MKRVFLALVAVVLLAASAFAQNSSSMLGGSIAANFNNWSMTSTSAVLGTSAQTMSFQPAACMVRAGNKTFFPLSTTASLSVSDGANTETVTPTTVTYNASACSVVATFGYAHAAGVTVSSGTSGLAEASVDASTNGFVWRTTAGGLDVYKKVTVAAAGTVRAVIGEITTNAATFTGTNLVGVRGSATIPSGTTASAGFVYGVQGKEVVAGILAGSSWTAGVVGQLDVSAATLTSGSHISPIWGDFGATGPAVTCTFCNDLVLTNTTATTTGSAIYVYSKSSVAFDLNSNGSAMLDASATVSGSAIGHILVTINGVPGVIRVYSGT